MIDGGYAKRKFVPMPKCGKGFERCFFLPINKKGELHSLILFLLVNRARRDSLAFRFEHPGISTGPHGYRHLQFARKIALTGRNEVAFCVPAWLPDSYPAFPVPARNSLEMFLSMVTAVHGFRGERGILCLIQDIFRKAGQPDAARELEKLLNKMLSASS